MSSCLLCRCAHNVVSPQTHPVKPSAQSCMYNAEDIFESLNFHHQELKLDNLVEIQKPSALEEADEPEPKERTMTDVKLTKGLGLTEVVSRCLRTLILLIMSSNN